MSNQDIFYEDWRACLRAHYSYVLQQQDMNNEQSLATVLNWTGFSDEEIAEMRQASGVEAFQVVEITEIPETIEAEPAIDIEPLADEAEIEPVESIDSVIETPVTVDEDIPQEQPQEIIEETPPEPPHRHEPPAVPPKQMSLF